MTEKGNLPHPAEVGDVDMVVTGKRGIHERKTERFYHKEKEDMDTDSCKSGNYNCYGDSLFKRIQIYFRRA